MTSRYFHINKQFTYGVACVVIFEACKKYDDGFHRHYKEVKKGSRQNNIKSLISSQKYPRFTFNRNIVKSSFLITFKDSVSCIYFAFFDVSDIGLHKPEIHQKRCVTNIQFQCILVFFSQCHR